MGYMFNGIVEFLTDIRVCYWIEIEIWINSGEFKNNWVPNFRGLRIIYLIDNKSLCARPFENM